MKKNIVPIFLPHYGCPHQCIFCNQKTTSTYEKIPTIEETKKIIEQGIGVTPCPEFAFYGGSFTALEEEIQNAYLSLVGNYENSGIRISTRPDYIDEKSLERLKKFNVTVIELGVQSMDEQVLLYAERGHTAEAVRNAVKLIQTYHIEAVLQMMLGLPGDSLEKSIDTAEKIAALKPSGVRIFPTVVVKGSKLYELWGKGEYQPLTIQQAVSWTAMVYEVFLKHDIEVIRVGLNTLKEMPAAGGYHNNLGELVISEIYYNRIKKMLLTQSAKSIYVGKGYKPFAIGFKKANKKRLFEEFGELEFYENEHLAKFDIHLENTLGK